MKSIRSAGPRIALLVAVLGPAAVVSHGQAGGFGRISGTVTDESGAAVKAALLLEDLDRGTARETEANEEGSYAFGDLIPGNYRVSASHLGFAGREWEDRIYSGEDRIADFKLKISTNSTSVTVRVPPDPVRQFYAKSRIITPEETEQMPIGLRGALGLTKIFSSSVGARGGSNPTGQIGHPDRAVVFAGSRSATNSYLANGIEFRGNRVGEFSLNLTIGSIDQQQVLTGFFLPEHGQGAAMLSIATKAGTQEFHGKIFNFLRNTKLDARSTFAQGPEDLKRNQFGAFVGGPLVKNKAWFFAGYEGLREVSAFAQRVRTPTERMFRGDFSRSRRVIFDPTTSIDFRRRTPFPNNTIPAGRVTATSRGLLEFYQQGDPFNGDPTNLVLAPRRELVGDQFNFRVDTTLTNKQILFGQYLHSVNPAFRQGLFPLSGRDNPNQAQLATLQHIYTPGFQFSNTVRLGFARNIARDYNLARNRPDLAPSLGIRNGPDSRGVPLQFFAGYASFGDTGGDLGNGENNYQVDDIASLLVGRHSLKFGFSLRHHRIWYDNGNAESVGSIAFSPNFTFGLAPLAGDDFAEFLLGLPTFFRTVGLPTTQYRYTQFRPFIQDSWKVNERLSVDFGLAWFLHGRPDPKGLAREFAHGFDFDAGLLTYAALEQVDRRIVQPDRNNFAPRLGIAWSPSEKTVIRAGGGVYYTNQQLIHLVFAAISPPHAPRNVGVQGGFPRYSYETGNVFPDVAQQPLNEEMPQQVADGASFLIRDENSPNPYVSQWTLTIQRSIGGGDGSLNSGMMELTYAGQSAHRLQNQYDFNGCRVGPNLFCDPKTAPYRYGEMFLSEHNGNSSYHALVAKHLQEFKFGLDMRVEYAWGKALTDAWESAGFSNSMITNNRSVDKDYAAFDVRHRAVLSTIWRVPYGAGRWWGEWSVSTIFQLMTGVPIPLSTPTNGAGNASITNRPSRLCEGGLPGTARENGLQVLDPSCFAAPSAGFFGNSSRSPLHGPGGNNWDIAVSKRFPLAENVNLQLRADLLNAFNRTQYLNPTGNIASPLFGRITASRPGRVIQLGLKLAF